MEEQKKLKFPIDFDKCPVCGETQRVADEVRKEEVAKGKIRPEARTAITMVITTIADDVKLNPLVPVPTLIGFIDC